MPITNMPAQNVGQFVNAAQAAGYTNTVRDDRRFAAGMAQRDRFHYDDLAFRANQDQVNYAQQMDYLQKQDEVQRQRFVDQIKTEQENTDWKYTKDQERALKQLEEDDRRIETLAIDEGWDDNTVRDMKWQNYQKRTGIQPSAMPKKDPWSELPYKEIDGKGYRRAPGRNGLPQWIPDDPNELDPQTAAELKFKAELEAPVKQREAIIEAAKLQREEQKERAANALKIADIIERMRSATLKGETKEEPRYTDQQIAEQEQKLNALLNGGMASPQEDQNMTPIGNGFFMDANGNVLEKY